jgi:hypothetical protein
MENIILAALIASAAVLIVLALFWVVVYFDYGPFIVVCLLVFLGFFILAYDTLTHSNAGGGNPANHLTTPDLRDIDLTPTVSPPINLLDGGTRI